MSDRRAVEAEQAHHIALVGRLEAEGERLAAAESRRVALQRVAEAQAVEIESLHQQLKAGHAAAEAEHRVRDSLVQQKAEQAERFDEMVERRRWTHIRRAALRGAGAAPRYLATPPEHRNRRKSREGSDADRRERVLKRSRTLD